MGSGNQKKIGNVFQEDFISSVPDNVYFERYKDAPALYKKVSNPADYFIFSGKFMLLVECKTTKDGRLPIGNIGMEQVWKMLVATCKKNTYGGFAINFRTYEETYFVFIGEFIYSFLKVGFKSLSLEWIRTHGYKISQKKKITRWKYGIEGLLEWVESSKYIPEENVK